MKLSETLEKKGRGEKKGACTSFRSVAAKYRRKKGKKKGGEML